MDSEKLIQDWLDGQLTQEDQKAFEALEDSDFYKTIIADASHFKASGFSAVDDFETFKNKVMVTDTGIRKLSWGNPVLRVASIVVVAFGLWFFMFSNPSTEIQTLAAQKTTIELPDASQVTLNAESEIAYNEGDWGSKREVLLKGEAFFDVAKGAKFDVVTDQGTVSVLGTEFTVKQRGTFFEVACFEGTVKVTTENQTQILHVGDKLQSTNGQFVMDKNTFEEPQWTGKELSYFKRVPINEVFAELERQYGISVSFENVDTQLLFTGGFGHKNLENAVIAIAEPLGLDYKILKPNTVRFTKRD